MLFLHRRTIYLQHSHGPIESGAVIGAPDRLLQRGGAVEMFVPFAIVQDVGPLQALFDGDGANDGVLFRGVNGDLETVECGAGVSVGHAGQVI